MVGRFGSEGGEILGRHPTLGQNDEGIPEGVAP